MSKEWVSYRPSPRVPVEVMRAHFEHHRYDLHAHESYSFGCTERARRPSGAGARSAPARKAW